jgi:hypothetical protein
VTCETACVRGKVCGIGPRAAWFNSRLSRGWVRTGYGPFPFHHRRAHARRPRGHRRQSPRPRPDRRERRANLLNDALQVARCELLSDRGVAARGVPRAARVLAGPHCRVGAQAHALPRPSPPCAARHRPQPHRDRRPVPAQRQTLAEPLPIPGATPRTATARRSTSTSHPGGLAARRPGMWCTPLARWAGAIAAGRRAAIVPGRTCGSDATVRGRRHDPRPSPSTLSALAARGARRSYATMSRNGSTLAVPAVGRV